MTDKNKRDSVVGYCLPDELKLIYAPPEEHRCVIGIDFGTSNSAAAYSLLDEEDIKPVVDSGGDQAKVTTTITLENAEPYRPVAFGRQALNVFNPDHHLLFHRFKMQLYDNPERQTLTPSAGRNIEVPTKVVIAGALKLLADEALQAIKDREGMDDLEDEDIIWVLTLPAIWAESAKLTMRQAAKEAGLISDVTSEKLIIALEPECAAISIRDDQENGAGTRYLILDCGGGTIDTAAFEVTGTAESDNLYLKSLLPPSGGDWGSTRIDRKFLHFLGDFFQGKINVDSTDSFEFMSSTWETAKKTFGSADIDNRPQMTTLNLTAILPEADDSFNLKDLVSAYNESHPGFELKPRGRGNLRLPLALMDSFFEDVLKDIQDHAKELIDKVDNLHKVVLVGGFAQSTLVQEAVRVACDEKGVTLLVAPQPSLSIVIGAVKFGLNPVTIVSRIIKRTIGVATSLSLSYFRQKYPGVDPGDRIYTTSQGEQRVTGIFDVFFKPGDDVKIEEAVENAYVPVEINQTKLSFKVVQTPRSEVVFIDDDECEKMTTVEVYVGNEGSIDDRSVDVKMYFSLTELVVLFKSVATNETQRARLTFDQVDTNFFQLRS